MPRDATPKSKYSTNSASPSAAAAKRTSKARMVNNPTASSSAGIRLTPGLSGAERIVSQAIVQEGPSTTPTGLNSDNVETERVVLPPVKLLIDEADKFINNRHYNYVVCPSMRADHRRALMLILRGQDTFTFTHSSTEVNSHVVEGKKWIGHQYKAPVDPLILFTSEIGGRAFPGVSVLDMYNGLDTLSLPNEPVFRPGPPMKMTIGITLAGNNTLIYFDIELPGRCTCESKAHQGTWTRHALAWEVCRRAVPVVAKFKQLTLNANETVKCTLDQVRLGGLDRLITQLPSGEIKRIYIPRFLVVQDPSNSAPGLPVEA